jgi:hypothetical protein
VLVLMLYLFLVIVIRVPRARNEDMSCGTLVRSCRLAMDILCLTCWSAASRWLPRGGSVDRDGDSRGSLAILGLGGEGAYMGVAPSNDWFSVRTHGAGPPGIELTWDNPLRRESRLIAKSNPTLASLIATSR